MAEVWDPKQYRRFGAEREAPFRDLLGLVEPPEPPDGRDGPARALDLGCGTGRLTRVLHERLAKAGPVRTLGVDRSAAMLAESDAHAGDGLAFERADLATFEPDGPQDVVFSNAALHWLPDHRALVARIASWLAPGGQLAVQVPANFRHPSHALAAEIAREAPFAEELRGWERGVPVLAPEEYATRLFELGLVEQHVRLVVYPHVLESPDAVVEWVKGTLLTAYRERLTEGAYADFLARYRERLPAALGHDVARGGPVFYPFQRILFRARRP